MAVFVLYIKKLERKVKSQEKRLRRNLEYMNKIYLVKHCFNVDGGFGDAISQEEVICGFDNREKELRS